MQRLTINGCKLECCAWGGPPSERPTIVLLHEGLGSVGLWKSFPDRLAEQTGCCVFAYSRAGYGRSDPAELPRPLDYMQREAVDVVPEVLDAIGFKRGILLGHSDGASIAAIHAASVVDARIRGIGLIAPHFFTEPEVLASITEAKAQYEKGDLHRRLARHHTNVDNAFRGWSDAWLNPGFGSWNIEELIGSIRSPIVAIRGREDQYGTIRQIEALINRACVPLKAEVLEDCGHSPHFDQQDRTLAILSDFLAQVGMVGQAEERRRDA
jgi:pimeloyl-ACP methyl ester carboxylesterase